MNRSPFRPAFALLTAAYLAAGAGYVEQGQAAGSPRQGDVVLRLKGGGFEVKGKLRAFDGTSFVLDAGRHGRMTLNAKRYECIGEACTSPPSAAALGYEKLYPERAETLAMLGAGSPGSVLLPALLKGYAAAADMHVLPVLRSGGEGPELRLVDAKRQRLATVRIARSDAAKGLAAVGAGAASMSISDRSATPEEERALFGNRPRLPTAQTEFLLGRDGHAVIVSPKNRVPALQLEMLARILAGQIVDWYELGHPPGRIKLHLRDEGSLATTKLTELLLAPRKLELKAAVVRHTTDQSLADAVARDREALGVVSLSAIRSARAINLETSCGLLIRPTPFAVKSGEYPLSLPIYLHAAGPPREAAARGLLRFVETEAAQTIVDESGFISPAPRLIGLEEQTERLAHATNAQGEAFDLEQMQAFLADLKGWKRLSITFQPGPSSRSADPQTKAKAERLVAILASPAMKNRKVLLAGFTDVDGGKFQANLAHSFKRAAQVKNIVQSVGGNALEARRLAIKGYGPLAPIACNDNADGRARNRRVEVWVSDE